MDKILFLSDHSYLDAPIKGGVQLCTAEYLSLLRQTQYEIVIHPIRSTRSYRNRLLIKLGFDVFHHYDYLQDARIINRLIDRQDIRLLALNQINLLPFVPLIKKDHPNIKTIVLSHGNESGDFLHKVVQLRSNPIKNLIRQLRLGRLLVAESKYFREEVDLMLSLSQEESYINQWMGIRNNFFVPRVFNPHPLNWEPEYGLLGFVGTLNHLPNLQGIRQLCVELAKNRTKLRIELVGNGAEQGKALEKEFPFVSYLGALNDGDLDNVARRWAFFLNPVFYLSRGASTKLATGINWGIPIVSTPFGNRGYHWKKGGIVTCKNVKELADFVEKTGFESEALHTIREDVLEVAQSGVSIVNLAHQLKDRLREL